MPPKPKVAERDAEALHADTVLAEKDVRIRALSEQVLK